MSVRQLLALKRASIQTRIDASTAKEAALVHQLSRLSRQGDGLTDIADGSAFQIAAQSINQARSQSARLTAQRQQLMQVRTELAKEKLALDIADKKLEAEEVKAQRLEASRAADRV
ncbi:MAG: hypothetical protein AAFP97_04050 [Pseudomonadota bacterium]